MSATSAKAFRVRELRRLALFVGVDVAPVSRSFSQDDWFRVGEYTIDFTAGHLLAYVTGGKRVPFVTVERMLWVRIGNARPAANEMIGTGHDGAIIQRAKRLASEGIKVESVNDAALFLALRGWTRSSLLYSMS